LQIIVEENWLSVGNDEPDMRHDLAMIDILEAKLSGSQPNKNLIYLPCPFVAIVCLFLSCAYNSFSWLQTLTRYNRTDIVMTSYQTSNWLPV
jgi:hypothetical protein